MAEHKLSKTRACAAVRLSLSSWYRAAPSTEQRDREVMDALNALIEKHPRWGFWKCFGRLRNTGHLWNHKRVYRVYKAMKLNLPRRSKRRLPARVQQPMVIESRANAEWSMDFMSDTLYHGRRFRTLNILDEHVVLTLGDIDGYQACWRRGINWLGHGLLLDWICLRKTNLVSGTGHDHFASTTVRSTCHRSLPTGAETIE